MIDFPCPCGYRFSLAEDAAGSAVQCPRCGRLNDAPTLADLGTLAADGTYTLRHDDPGRATHTFSDFARAFSRDKVDASGNEKDLRPTYEDILEAGVDETPLELAGTPRPGAPRYDPVTGELIRPLELAPPRKGRPAEAPVPFAKPALNYAVRDTDRTRAVPPRRVFAELFTAVNLAVIAFFYLLHLFAEMMFISVLAGFFFTALPMLLVAVLLLGHYGNVVDEIGVEGRDELPRPFRHLGWREDVWGPFVHFAGALVLCYAPAGVALNLVPDGPTAWIVAGLLALAGSFFVPAVFLTGVAGGTARNLRPDRVLGVIRACGPRYAGLALLWVAAAGAYFAGVVGVHSYVVRWFSRAGMAGPGLMGPAAFLVLFVGLYAMHYFCWMLGLVYRARHEQFPWVLQRHVKASPRHDPEVAARLAAARARNDARTRRNTETAKSRTGPAARPGE